MIKILVLAKQKTENYVRAIESLGCCAIVNPPFPLKEDFDGLLLCGGNDIHPSYYGQEVDGAKNFDTSRDETEFKITKAFIDTGKPIFGICRGHQLLNVALGGTLIQDLDCAFYHTSCSGIDGEHSVEATGFLEKLYGKDFFVNSSHHQGIDKLGQGLVVSAQCDGVIEAVEHTSLPFFSVQFHPERMCLDMKSKYTVDGLKLFEYFVELIKR